MKQKILNHFKGSWKTYAGLAAFSILSTKVDATAIERMGAATNGLSGLIKGTLGETVLFVSSIGGAVGAFMKGSGGRGGRGASPADWKPIWRA